MPMVLPQRRVKRHGVTHDAPVAEIDDFRVVLHDGYDSLIAGLP
jgi:hypothetical protein